jgi:NADPH2:quinone reductase
MKAAYVEKPGPADTIRYGDLPDPLPKAAEVLVRVGAVDVNPVETYVRSGAVAMPIPLPYIPGCDLAGVVEQLGPAARRFKIGDRVWGSNQGLLGRQGTYAELAAVDECWLYPTPASVSDQQATATALIGITAHLGLVRDARLRAGETLFIHGGSGGVGSTVVQMAKTLGARVITTASSDPKLAICRECGADLAINYKTEDVEARTKELAPEGVDVYWETYREPDFDRTVRMLAPRGRMILMAGRDARPQFPVGPFYVKGCHLLGFAMFNATSDEQRSAAEDINAWLASGKLKTRIDRVLPLSEAATAHRLQEGKIAGKESQLMGKIVLTP